MRWTAIGVKTTYIGTEPPALKVASPAADGRPDKNPKYDWKLIQPAAGKQGPSIAMSDGTPDRTKTVIACADNIPVLVVSFPPGVNAPPDRKSTRLNSSHSCASRMPSSA